MRTTNAASCCRAVFTCVLIASAASSLAVEKSSEQVSPFIGSFGYSVPIEVPAFRGLEPQLALAYTSEGRNGFVGVGWTVTGFGTLERTNAGGGTPRFDAQDVFNLGGSKLLTCVSGLTSPSCNTGGTHTTETESFTRVRFDAATNTWTVWAKNGVRTIFSPLLTAAGGTYRWGQTAVVDPLGNTVDYGWTCSSDCYPSSVSYGPYQIALYREARPDVISFARGADLGRTSERLRSIVVTLVGGGVIRGYKLAYALSALTGRSLLAKVQQYGRDLTHDGAGAFTAGSTLPPQTFTYTEDPQGRVFVTAQAAAPTPPTTTEAVSWAERENATPIADGSSLQKSGGTQNTWDALASSTRALASGDGFVEVTAGNEPGKRFGLSRKVKDFTPDEIDFSFLEGNDATGHVVTAYQKGTALGTWPASSGSVLRIEISAGVVLFKVNGAVVHSLTGARLTYPLVAAASLAFNGAVLQSARVSGALQDASSWCWGEGLLTGDFDGDGRTDQACFTNFTTGLGQSSPTLRVKLSTGSGFGDPVVWRTGSDFSHAVGGDFNNDGRTDFALYAPWSGDFSVTLSTGTSFAEPAVWGHAAGVGPDGYPYACDTPYAALGAGDFNGDGKLDVSCRRADSGWPLAPSPIFIGLSNGSSFAFGVWNTLGCDAPAFQRTGSIDFDGDGKDDWYCQSAAGHLDVYLSNGATFNWATFGSLGPSFCGSRYIFGDFNADGRTDAACADNGKVALSTGTRFLEQGSFGAWCAVVPTEEPLSTQVFAADVDGDGASEIVCNNSQAGTSDIQVRRWDGSSLTNAETWKAQWCEGLLRPGDFDGDGKSDLLCDHLGTPVAFAGGVGRRVDLLSRTQNTLGGMLSVDYTPSTSFPNDNNPGSRPVVTSLTRDDGRGGTGTSTFTYAGGRIDRERRRFLGFRFVREIKPCLEYESTCPRSETWLRQDPFVPGLPERTDALTGSGQPLSSRRFEYTASAVAPYVAHLSGEWAYAHDSANAGVFKRTYTTHAYDAWGNESERIEHGDFDVLGDESTRVQTFVPNTGAFIVGLPASRELRAGVGSGGTLLTRERSAYDGAGVGTAPTAGLVTREESWLDTTNTHVMTATRVFDAWGNATSVSDATGASSVTAFDAAQHLFPISIVNPVGDATSVVWDAGCVQPTETTDANGQVTHVTLDAFCRTVRKDGPLGSFEEYSFKDQGVATTQRVQTETLSPTGNGGTSLKVEYLDGFGRTYRTTSPGPSVGKEIVSEQTYTARGGLASRTEPYYANEPEPTPTRYEHDGLDRVVRAILPDGATATTSFGAWAQTKSDPLGRSVTVTHDAFGREVRAEQDDGQGRLLSTRRVYDLRGALTSFRDPAGSLWGWQYDSLGRPSGRSDPDSGTWTLSYDVAARKTTQVDAKGQLTEQWSDAAGRPTQKRTTDAVGRTEVVTFAYGEARAGFLNQGRLTTMTDAQGTARYDYDALGHAVRLTRTLDGIDYVLRRRYDSAGRLLGTTFPDGDAVGTPTSPLEYDAAGRLIAAPGIVNLASYDALGRARSSAFSNGVLASWEYAERGWLTNVTTTSGTSIVQNLSYTMDAAGRAVHVASPMASETWSYTYDALGRLVSAVSPTSGLDQHFQYDDAGNMTYNSRVGTLVYPPPGAPRAHAPTSVNGQSMSYDANGNLTTGRGRTLTWSADNRPLQVNDSHYVYDGLGTRLKRTAPGSVSLYPVGDDYEITNGVVTKYVTLPGLGRVAKRTGSTTYWLHADRLGSVQALTDVSGAVVQRRTYRPYGEPLADATTHVESRGYIGERQDADTGLSYLHARYYDATLGLFLSPDPLAPTEVGVGFNRYAYGGGDPIGSSDPSGYAANQLCGTQWGDREDCQSGSGYYFQLGGGISWTDGGSGNVALDQNEALADHFFTTQPVTQVLDDGTTLLVQRDRDGSMTVTLISESGEVLSQTTDSTYTETSGGCRESGGVRCRTFGTLESNGGADPFDGLLCLAGVCDGLSMGLGPLLRGMLGTDPNGLVDTGASSYQAGELAGTVGSMALSAGAAAQASNPARFGRLLRASPIFGTRGILNSNSLLRVGVGRAGGLNVFRLSGTLLRFAPRWLPGLSGTHWTWFTFGPL